MLTNLYTDHGEEVARQCHQWLLEMNINLSLNLYS